MYLQDRTGQGRAQGRAQDRAQDRTGRGAGALKFATRRKKGRIFDADPAVKLIIYRITYLYVICMYEIIDLELRSARVPPPLLLLIRSM